MSETKSPDEIHITSFSANQQFSPTGGKRAALLPKVISGTKPKQLAKSLVYSASWDRVTFPNWSCVLTFVNVFVYDDMSVFFEANFYGKRGDVWIIRPGMTFFQDFGTGMAQIGRPLGQHESQPSNPPAGFDAGDNYFSWDDTIDGTTSETVKLINAMSGFVSRC